jgi:phenylacetate-CoA ligase
MKLSTREERARREGWSRAEVETWQLARLNAMLAAILPDNEFYRLRLAGAALPLAALDGLAGLPFTHKEDLATRPADGLAANLTWPAVRYTRYHQTSGTRGRPMPVLDTAEDWQWWLEGWQYVLDAAEIGAGDRLFLAFSFGPFIGFWTAFEAGLARGALVVPGGGLSSHARLELMRASRATALFCTPSYALRLAEVAEEHQINAAGLGIKTLVLAGEPGGSLPATRARLAKAWRATVIDHGGATEVGPWGYGDRDGRGLYVVESEFIAEFLSVAHGGPAAEGELAEMVLTNLGRYGSPLIRYRTGDLVRPRWRHEGASRFVLLEGGVLGRADDMVVVRGVNVFPSAIEQIVHGFPEIVEYRVTVTREAEMDCLAIEIEDRLGDPRRVAEELGLRLGLTLEVAAVPLGSLPRFEGKGKRFVDRR